MPVHERSAASAAPARYPDDPAFEWWLVVRMRRMRRGDGAREHRVLEEPSAVHRAHRLMALALGLQRGLTANHAGHGGLAVPIRLVLAVVAGRAESLGAVRIRAA